MSASGGPTAQDRAWAALAAELAPAKSLARVDAASARVVATVGVVGALLTGIGLVGAGLASVTGPARVLAAATVVLAAAAVVVALCAQVLSITRGLNPNNLIEVQEWYERRFQARAPLTRAATGLIVLAVITAGTAGVSTVVSADPGVPSIAITRTTTPADLAAEPRDLSQTGGSDTVEVEVTFRDLAPGQVATASISTTDGVLAQAALTPTPQGTATRTLTAEQVATDVVVTVDANAGGWACTGTLTPGTTVPVVDCHTG